jgi:Zn-dependent protease with chaperone function
MITFDGIVFDGNSAAGQPVHVVYNGRRLIVRRAGGGILSELRPDEVSVKPGLGNTHRVLSFPGGIRCETADRRAVEALERELGMNMGGRFVARLERRWWLAGGCLVGLVAAVAAFIWLGIPLLAEKAAGLVPLEIAEELGRRTVSTLDEQLFEPSGLDPAAAEDIHEIFFEVKDDLGSPAFNYRLEFRCSPMVGANAFALPSGMIVVTDELVETVKERGALMGILAHEITHVENRHAFQSVFQHAGVFLLITILTGDITSISATAATLPTVLIESGYSRKFEKEADLIAGQYLIRKNVGTEAYRNALVQLSGDDGAGVPSFFTSHPGGGDRVAYLRQLEEEEAEQ